MGSRHRTWTPRSARTSRPPRILAAAGRPSSRCSVVEGNFRVETPMIPEVRIDRAYGLPEVQIEKKIKPREITINDSPMMLLPKARVRESMEYYDQFRQSYNGVVADTSTQGLHISTIQSVTGLVTRIAPKSAIKHRKNSLSRSEADSGFCSLKRSVTFENLSRSQSTVFRSDDEYDNLSETSSDEKYDCERIPCPSPEIADSDDFPMHLESFGNDGPVIPSPPLIPPRPLSRQCHSEKVRRRRHGEQDGHDAESCEICGVVLSDSERVKRSFGRVDTFLDWVMSKWGKVSKTSRSSF